MDHDRWMSQALVKARQGVAAGQTPFGACIVKEDQLVTCSHNQVWAQGDITAHAEIVAIRDACAKLGTIDLSGCVIYSTCEPCPMCFSACHWARIGRIVYGASIHDARESGFNELPISNEQMKHLGTSRIELIGGVMREENVELLRSWSRQQQSKGY